MSKKILHNLFGYAAREGAEKITIESRDKRLSFNCHFPHEEERSFVLPKKLEYDLADNLRKMLEIAPGDLANKKYCKINHKNYQLSFRASIVPDKHGEKIIISIIKKNNKLWRLNQLGLENKSLKTIKKTIKSRSGLIIVGSPDMQGRSTTFYSLLQELDKDNLNIYLLERNIEHSFPGINVVNFNSDNFNKILNHDSDVIAFEATEDDADMKKAFLAANSGRLVIMTMRADDIWEIMLKVLNLDLPLKLKLENLKLILNQRINKLKKLKKISAKNGRSEIGLFEILAMTEKIKDFILEAKKNKHYHNFWQKLLAISLDNGYWSLSEDRKQKVKNGLIDKQEL